jgi:hypothetical protein
MTQSGHQPCASDLSSLAEGASNSAGSDVSVRMEPAGGQTVGMTTGEHARRITATRPNEYLRFANCGLSDQTIRALLIGGIDSPERLLSMTPNQIRLIRGMEVTVMKEVERYRTQSK